ncbi:ABC transporter ATP-binding protein, partial [Rhizobiaceae sp. 2RAB30]
MQISIALQRSTIEVVNDVSFRIPAGGTVAVVGESGSGKSITAQAILGILPQVATVTGGSILFRDPEKPGSSVDIAKLEMNDPAMQKLRGARISMIFQEPMTSLNPVFRVGYQISEAIRVHHKVSRGEARDRAIAMLEQVRIPSPAERYASFPHQMSGGMRQRVMIAMALACRPKVMLADEPTTALDVTIQAQILKLMNALRREIGTSILLIT